MATVYIYYLHDQKMTKDEYDYVKHNDYLNTINNSIYALTINKKFAKRFEEERDMKRFVRVKQKMDKETARITINSHQAAILDLYKYKYFPNIEGNSEKSMMEVEILSTTDEYRSVVTSTEDGLWGLNEFLQMLKDVYPFKLKRKYVDSLDTLGLIGTWKFIRSGVYDSSLSVLTSVQNNMGIAPYEKIPDEYNSSYDDFPDAYIDEVQLFSSMYHDMFK